MFQSLFFWNHCLDLWAQLFLLLTTDVSILVFLEPLLRHHLVDLLQFLQDVSILVFLEPLLRPWHMHSPIILLFFVSILVFLEPLLRPLLFGIFHHLCRVSILVFLEPLLRLRLLR